MRIPLAASLANTAWLAGNLPAYFRFRRALSRPERVQQSLLSQLLRQNAQTAYGRKHGFSDLGSYEEFADNVPIVRYAELEPWINRIRAGESQVLTRETVTRLVPTSGSSSGQKLIPFTTGLQRQFNEAIGAWMVDLACAYPSVPLGPSYWSISPAFARHDENTSAVPIGFDDDSAYLGGLQRKIVAQTFAVPSSVRLIANVQDFRYATLLCLLRCEELRLVSVWHPSFLTLLLDSLAADWNELLGDIKRGGCSRAAGWDSALRRSLSSQPDPERARHLRDIGPEDFEALWPNLQVVSCWGHAQAELAATDLARRLPHAAIQRKGLLATEGFVSLPFRGAHPAAVTSHFFEFADECGRIRRVHELESGSRYRTIVTTAGGLWRYDLGDWVEVDGFIDATPSVRFVGRGSSVSDLRGEKLSEIFVTEVLRQAFAGLGMQPQFAMLAPENCLGEPPGYTLFITADFRQQLARQLDAALSENPHYRICRELGQLREVRCCWLQKGAEARFIASRTAEGARLGEIKPQSLSDRTDWRGKLAGSG